MGRLRRIFNQIIDALPRFRRRSRPEDIPRRLDAETLERALHEARLLHARHAVEVASLAPGERPSEPRRADAADETH